MYARHVAKTSKDTKG